MGTNVRNPGLFVNTADLYDPGSDTWTREDGPEGFEGSLHLAAPIALKR
ncbi:hypothetical protein [Sorangium sp. So ce1153]